MGDQRERMIPPRRAEIAWWVVRRRNHRRTHPYICHNGFRALARRQSLPVHFVSKDTIDSRLDILTDPIRSPAAAVGTRMNAEVLITLRV